MGSVDKTSNKEIPGSKYVNLDEKEIEVQEEVFANKYLNKINEPYKENVTSSASRIYRVIKSIKSSKLVKIIANFFTNKNVEVETKKNLIVTIDNVRRESLKSAYKEKTIHHNDFQTNFPPLENTTLSQPMLMGEKQDTETTFTHDFLDQNKVVIRESVTRAKTVDVRIKGLEAKLALLSIDDPDYQQTDNEYIACLRSVGGASWASTNAPRLLFKNAPNKVAAKQDQSKILTNLRMHTVTDTAGKVVSKVTRSGALSDFTHGEISLQELKEFEAIVNDKNTQLLLVRGDKTKFMQKMQIKAIRAYGSELLDQNLLKEEELGVLDKIDKDQNLTNDDLKIILDMSIDNDKLIKVIEKRKNTLETLALQDLYLHFKTTPVTQYRVLYGRTSLVDMTKPANGENGLVIDERTQCLDMKALYNGLQNKKIVFDDSSGPFIDKDGVIHMPMDCSNGVKTTTLDTYYFNVSVQGNTANTGIQQKINDEMLAKFEAMRKKPGIDINALSNLIIGLDKLKRSKSQDAYKVALQTIKLASSLGGYCGVNCYGGKDRTGYLLALNTDSYLPDSNRNLKARWREELLNVDSNAAKIAYQNANHRVLKLTRFNLSLFNVNSVSGIFNRIKSYFMVAKSIIKLSVLKVSIVRSKGQLHDNQPS